MKYRIKLSAGTVWQGIGALCITAIAAGPSADPAKGQSLSQSMANALAGGCGGLDRPLGPQLAALCAEGGPNPGVDSPQGGTSSGVSDQGSEDQGEKRRLQDLRNKKSGLTTPQMTQFADASGSDSTFDLGQFSGFFNFDYQNVARRTTFFTNGFDSDRYGGTIGVDRSFDKFVLGVALDYGHTDATFRGGGGNFNADAYGVSLYGSVAPQDNMFIDAVVGYDHKDNTINRNVSFAKVGNPTVTGVAQGTPSTEEFRANVGGGYDFTQDNITFGPRVGFAYSRSDVDAYSESGTTGLELAYSSQTFQSFTSSIGGRATIAISTSFGVIVPQVSADYIHEFKDSQQTFTARFVQDLSPVPTILAFQNDQPHRDYVGLGIGAVLGLPHGISCFANYRALVGDTLKTTQTVTGGVRMEF